MKTEPWVTAEHVAQHLGVAKDYGGPRFWDSGL